MNSKTKNTQNPGGRKVGSKSKYNSNSREALLEVFKDKFQRMDKDIAFIPFDERFTRLKPYAKILCNSEDEISRNTKEIIFNSLKGEFRGNKFKSYLNLLSPQKKAIEMRHYLQMLSPSQIEEIFGGMNRV